MSTALAPAVVVVGGAGSLGRALVSRWTRSLRSFPAEERPQVVCLDLRPNREADVSITANLSDVAAVERQLFGRFAVQSMVVAVKPPLVGPSYQAFMELNVAGVTELARLAQSHDVGQFVYASSIACCNHWEAHWNCSEADPAANPPLTQLHSPYDMSKAVAERYILQCHSSTGMRTASIRLGGIYGQEDDPYWHRRLPLNLSFDLGWDPAFPQVDSNYVGNVAAALLCVEARLRDDASVGGRYYFYTHGDRRVSQQELSITLARRSGRLHLGTPLWMLRHIVAFAQFFAMLPFLLPSWPFGQKAGRAITPKSYFSEGSMLGMGLIHQSFDNSLFRATFAFSHVYTVEQAVERIIKHERSQQRRSGGIPHLVATAVLICILTALAVRVRGAVDLGVDHSPLLDMGASLHGLTNAFIAMSSPAMHLLAFAALPAYKLWQPFEGGLVHVTLQALGWTLFSVMCIQWLLTVYTSGATAGAAATLLGGPDRLSMLIDDKWKAASGLSAQVMIFLSLLAFQGRGQASPKDK